MHPVQTNRGIREYCRSPLRSKAVLSKADYYQGEPKDEPINFHWEHSDDVQ